MRQLYAILTCVFSLALLPISYGQYTTVINDGSEILQKVEIDEQGSGLVSDLTITEQEVLDAMFYRRVLLRAGFMADMLIGYARETANGEQVYFRAFGSDTDVLVYDITLDVGESITLALPYCDGQSGMVATVTSVAEVDGRRVLTFDRTFGDALFCETLTFTEGVGPNATLTFPYFMAATTTLGEAARLCRVRIDGDLVYPATNDNTDLCGLAVPVQEPAFAETIRVWPNPASGTVYLSGVPAGARVQIVNAMGQPVAATTDAQLDISQLPAGLYYWLCPSANEGRGAKGRLVRQ